jgi:Protein of unknown function (DUF3592)
MKQKIFSKSDRYLLLFLATPLLLFYGYSFIKNQQTAVRLSTQVEGEVVDLSHRYKRKVFPVVSYTASDGQKYQIKSSALVQESSYSIGQKVKVHYNPLDPKDAHADGMYYCWAPVLAVTIIWSFLSFIFFLTQYKFPKPTPEK